MAAESRAFGGSRKMVLIDDDPASVSIAVKDTGTGIPADQQKYLFQPFTQLSADPKQRAGGTGLGLAISKRLTELMGGTIRCTSLLDQGSEFRFSFQLENSVEQSKVSRPNLSGNTIVVDSEDPHFREIVVEGLKQYGGQVMALSYSEADGDKRPDLVIVDNSARDDQWRQAAMGWREMAPIPIIVAGRSGRLEQLVQSMRVSFVQRYPIKMSEVAAFAAELLQLGHLNDFLAGEADRQERIAHKFSNLKIKAKRILVAEDNIINQKVAVSMLDQLGLESDTVSNGQEAVLAAQGYNYDAILMDCRMPVLDGYEAAKRIRGISEYYKNAPIIAVTANAMPSERIRSDQASMDTHLQKPITIDALKVCLEEFLGSDEGDTPTTSSAASLAKDGDWQTDEQIVDETVVGTLRGLTDNSGNNLLVEVLRLFREGSPRLLDDMEAAIANRDSQVVSSLAHKLKGSARNIGAKRLATACGLLEGQAAAGQLKEAQTVLQVITNEMAAVIDYFSHRTEGEDLSRGQ